MTALFITGVGTEVGKTVTACALIGAARARGLTVDAFKPVLSGFDRADATSSDAGRLLAALGRPLDDLDEIAPLRFIAPLSPPDAARREEVELRLADIQARCEARIAAFPADGLLLIEGAGGVMSPIAQDGLNLDLMAALNLPVVLAAANYLGAINHTLTALAALRERRIRVAAVVVQTLTGDGPALADTLAALAQFAPETPILSGPGWEESLIALL